MLLISTIFLTVSLTQSCASYLLIPCNLMNWSFLSLICRRSEWGQSRFLDFCLRESLFTCGAWVCFYVAASLLTLQTRLSLGGFLSPILDYPLLPLQLLTGGTAPGCHYKSLSLRNFYVAFWDLPLLGPPYQMPQLLCPSLLSTPSIPVWY